MTDKLTNEQLKKCVGRLVIRTAPIVEDDKNDWLLTQVPIEIVKVTDWHIYARIPHLNNKKGGFTVFGPKYLDGEWVLFETDPSMWDSEDLEKIDDNNTILTALEVIKKEMPDKIYRMLWDATSKVEAECKNAGMIIPCVDNEDESFFNHEFYDWLIEEASILTHEYLNILTGILNEKKNSIDTIAQLYDKFGLKDILGDDV